ncbi:rhomboid family intramembrane serine protease [Pseudonocardia hydrocarbonoxydans]|nr:rhomboid family intramembrane serine protease [Pseudonocardia hydrocarbonoxydans]
MTTQRDTASPPGPRDRWSGAAALRLRATLRHAPVTTGLVAALWVIGISTGSLLGGPAAPLRSTIAIGVPTLSTGSWWTPLTSMLWCSGPVGYLATTALLLGLLAPVEHRAGPVRTAALLIGSHAVGVLGGTGLVALGAAAGEPWALRLATDVAVGPSPGVVGAALAVSVRLGALWRRRLRVLVVVVLVMLALYSGSLQDVLRLGGGLVGLAAGPVLLGRPRGRVPGAATGPEVRTLVALVVAASAAGPLIAALSGTAIGPLSVLRFLVLPPPPDPATVAAICADPATVDDCAGLQFRLRLGGVGPAVCRYCRCWSCSPSPRGCVGAGGSHGSAPSASTCCSPCSAWSSRYSPSRPRSSGSSPSAARRTPSSTPEWRRASCSRWPSWPCCW